LESIGIELKNNYFSFTIDYTLMRKIQILGFVIILISWVASCSSVPEADSRFVSFESDPAAIKMYWKDNTGNILGSIGNLKKMVEGEGKQLKFAMNGGMYLPEDQSPVGLFIDNGNIIKPLNTKVDSGNFYWQPNGVFYINKSNQAFVCKSEKFKKSNEVKYATQSGPMLVIDGKIHPEFKEGSSFVHIRNGVGILPNGKVIMAISKEEVTLYDFAKFFLDRGCQNALYLDGFVSRMYCPEKGMNQLDGDFGVMIGVEK
jgi:uncharacterized protein YigE (DUF2233 family)